MFSFSLRKLVAFLLLSVIFLFASQKLNGQQPAGTWQAGMSYGTLSDFADANSWALNTKFRYSLSLSPEASYFISDRFSAGMQLGFGLEYDSGTALWVTGSLLFVRQYLPGKYERWQFFLEEGGGAFWVGETGHEVERGFLLQGAFGTAWQLADRVLVEGKIGLDFTNFMEQNYVNAGIRFGVQLLFDSSAKEE